MDLNPLKIDRSAERSPVRRARSTGAWIVRLALLLGLVLLLLLFRRPILGAIDRLRLPEVRVLVVSASSPLAAGAVQGTAANGYVVARVRAALSADTPGRIVEMNVTEGQVVPAGFVVARLYADEYRALFERAEADLALARAGATSAAAAREVSVGQLAAARARVGAAEAEVADAQAALALAEVELGRAETLVAERITSQAELDRARAERDRARARLAAVEASRTVAQENAVAAERELALAVAREGEAAALVAVKSSERDQARATLDKTEVRAPFDGIVVLKDAEVGEVVSPNAVGAQSRGSVATMVDPRTYEVQVELPEASLAAVEVGASAQIFLDAFPQQGYAGRVLRIWPTANRQKATVEVRVGIDEPDARLRPEMGARVVFGADAPPREEGSATPVILLPRSAFVMLEGRPHAFVLERDVARLRAVQLGEERSGRVVVAGGLVPGERLVDAPPDDLRDGDRVRVEG
ncbi:MAG TPA: efflux RND transporter periplasmic adaptor subunit [Planctomycetota bacterium]